jgi:hypothetical protein
MNSNIKSMLAGLEDNQCILPVGYVDDEGVLQREVTLAPMTGETEEAIGDPKIKDNAGKIVTELLNGVITKFGTMRKVNKDVIRGLTAIDRDYLVLKNRQVSIGDIMEYTDTCPICGRKTNVRVDLTSLEVVYMDDDEPKEFKVTLFHGVPNKDGVIQKEATIVLPNGMAQEKIAQIIRSNPAQATTAMLQFITKSIGDIEFISAETFRKMTKKDRDLISARLDEVKAGVKFSVEVICAECGGEFTTYFPMSSLMGE